MTPDQLNLIFPEVENFDRIFCKNADGNWSVHYEACYDYTFLTMGVDRMPIKTIQIGEYYYEGWASGGKEQYYLL